MLNLRTDFFATAPKDAERAELNEDAWLGDDASQRWALSDGASESYDSRTWALRLVRRYVENPAVDFSWVDEAVKGHAASIDVSSLSWSKQAACERGSFATLLGVERAPNGTDLEVLAVGDSLAVHVRAGRLLSSYPFQTASEFEVRPQLLSTLMPANAFVLQSGFMTRNSSRTWTVHPGDHVYLMTDAVGQWLLTELSQESSSLNEIEMLREPEQLHGLVQSRRSEKRMKLDDSTLVRLVVEN